MKLKNLKPAIPFVLMCLIIINISGCSRYANPARVETGDTLEQENNSGDRDSGYNRKAESNQAQNSGITFPDNTWVPLNWTLNIIPGALPPGVDPTLHHQSTINWFGGLTYKSDAGEILVMDGYHGNGGTSDVLGRHSIYANALYGMDPVIEKYNLHKVCNYNNGYDPTELTAQEWTPCPRHTYDYWTYASPTNSLYLMNGANKYSGYAAKDATKSLMLQYGPQPWVQADGRKTMGMWRYSFDDRKWYSLHASVLRPELSGYEGVLIYVPEDERIYGFSSGIGKVYSFDIHTEQWRYEGVEVTGWSCYRGATFFDTKRNRVVFFGGKQHDQSASQCEIGVFDLDTKSFALLPVSGSKPRAPRSDPAFDYSARHDMYVLFGGAGTYKDNWAFDPNTNTWKQFTPKQNIPLNGEHVHLDMIYDAKNDLFVLKRSEGAPGKWFAMRFNPGTADWLSTDLERY
jgi:hypothetical protein